MFQNAAREIVNNFESDGLLMKNAKASVFAAELERDLMNNKVFYAPLVDILNKMESTKYTIQHAYNDLNNLNLEANPAFVDPYMNNKLDGHEMNSVIRLSMSEISPTTYGLLHNCQATSASVERSF